LKRRLEKGGHNLTCEGCGEPIRVNEVVVSRILSRSRFRDTRRRFFHPTCWEALFVELEEAEHEERREQTMEEKFEIMDFLIQESL